MATKNTETGVYRVTEIIGTSPYSWEAAAKNAVKIDNGKIVAYRARVSLSFKYDA